MAIPKKVLRDSARLALQSAAAAAATYFAMTWLGWTEISWAVISALFVVQQSLDGTMTAAMGRLAGTVLGTIIGFLSVQFLGGEELTPLRIAIAALTMNAIANVRPGWRFGVVSAAIIALEENPAVLEGALDRAGGILLGSLIGTAAAFLVWPESARSRALRAAHDALDVCRDLLRAMLSQLSEGRSAKLEPLHQRFRDSLGTARSMAQSTRKRRAKAGERLDDLVHSVERLWHALIILERVTEGSRRPDLTVEPEVARDLDAVAQAALDYLECASDREEKTRGLDDVHAAIAKADRTIQRHATDGRALQPLAFALGEVGSNLAEVDRGLDMLD